MQGLDEAARDRQAQAGTRAHLVALLDPVELVEDALQIVGGMPSPSSRICRPALSIAPALDADGRVRRRILGGVVEEIEQHLLEQHGVHRQHREVGAHRDFHAMLGEDLPGALQRAAHDLAQVVRRGIRHDGAGLELGHVEQVGDEAVEPLGFLDDRGDEIGLGVVVERRRQIAQSSRRAQHAASGVLRSWEMEVRSAERSRSVSAVRWTRSMSSTR